MHTIPAINPHWRAITFQRFTAMFQSIPHNNNDYFKSERWYVLSQCGAHIYSVVIYFSQFDQSLQYHAQRVR